jgi:hypothetical protein
VIASSDGEAQYVMFLVSSVFIKIAVAAAVTANTCKSEAHFLSLLDTVVADDRSDIVVTTAGGFHRTARRRAETVSKSIGEDEVWTLVEIDPRRRAEKILLVLDRIVDVVIGICDEPTQEN